MTWLIRWLRLRGFARGPLSRRSDRAQRTLFVGAVIAALVAIPVAVNAADGVQPEPAVAVYQTTATLNEDAHVPVAYSQYGVVSSTYVKANWQTASGTTRSGDIKVNARLKAGTRVSIWVDQAGSVLDGPPTSTQDVVQVFLVSTAAVVEWIAGVLVCYALIAWLLFRRRVEAWASAWERADRDWRRTV